MSDCCFNAKRAIFSAILWGEQAKFDNMKNDVRFVRYQYTKLHYYSARSLKQQPTGRHVVPLRHIILTMNQPIFALTPESCMLSEKQLIPIS